MFIRELAMQRVKYLHFIVIIFKQGKNERNSKVSVKGLLFSVEQFH